MTTTFEIAGFTISVATIIGAFAVVQFVLMALAAVLSGERNPKKGMRSAEQRLLISTAVLAIAWIAVFSIGGTTAGAQTTEATTVARKAKASCSTVENDMAASVVRSKMGEPDEIRADEETRGPGAAIWIYRDSRCSVHIFDNKVEFID